MVVQSSICLRLSSLLTVLCISAPVRGEASSMKFSPLRGVSAFGASSRTFFARRSSSDVHVSRNRLSPMASFFPCHTMTSLGPKLRVVGCKSHTLSFVPTGTALSMGLPYFSAIDTANETESVNISIEYCSACRWMLRSNWIASELLTTFAHEAKLTSVTMVNQSPPLSEGGIFRISASSGSGNKVTLWDRKDQGRFPESKEVKQLVRDCVNPDKGLGHSDNRQTSVEVVAGNKNVKESDCVECNEEQRDQENSQQTTGFQKQTREQPNDLSHVPSIFYKSDHVSIEYSTGTSIDSPENALYRATYYANELLSMIYKRNAWWKKKQEQGEVTSDDDLGDYGVPVAVDSVTLIPNRVENGILRVYVNGHKILFEHADDASATATMDGARLRNIVKEAILHGGSSDESRDDGNVVVEMMDDDEADEARKFFGVF